MSEREQFEAALAEKPEVRFWNTTDAMFWAWQASRAQPAQAGQVLTDDQWQLIADITESFLTRDMKNEIEAVLAKRVPMTDAQIAEFQEDGVFWQSCKHIVRDIERHHGIVGEKGGA